MRAHDALQGVMSSLTGKQLSYIEMLGIIRVAEGAIYENMVQDAAEIQMKHDRPDYLG